MEGRLLIAFIMYDHDKYYTELITEDKLEEYVKYALAKMCGIHNEMIGYRKIFEGSSKKSGYKVYEVEMANEILDDIYTEKYTVNYIEVSGEPNTFLQNDSLAQIKE